MSQNTDSRTSGGDVDPNLRHYPWLEGFQRQLRALSLNLDSKDYYRLVKKFESSVSVEATKLRHKPKRSTKFVPIIKRLIGNLKLMSVSMEWVKRVSPWFGLILTHYINIIHASSMKKSRSTEAIASDLYVFVKQILEGCEDYILDTFLSSNVIQDTADSNTIGYFVLLKIIQERRIYTSENESFLKLLTILKLFQGCEETEEIVSGTFRKIKRFPPGFCQFVQQKLEIINTSPDNLDLVSIIKRIKTVEMIKLSKERLTYYASRDHAEDDGSDTDGTSVMTEQKLEDEFSLDPKGQGQSWLSNYEDDLKSIEEMDIFMLEAEDETNEFVDVDEKYVPPSQDSFDHHQSHSEVSGDPVNHGQVEINTEQNEDEGDLDLLTYSEYDNEENSEKVVKVDIENMDMDLEGQNEEVPKSETGPYDDACSDSNADHFCSPGSKQSVSQSDEGFVKNNKAEIRTELDKEISEEIGLPLIEDKLSENEKEMDEIEMISTGVKSIEIKISPTKFQTVENEKMEEERKCVEKELTPTRGNSEERELSPIRTPDSIVEMELTPIPEIELSPEENVNGNPTFEKKEESRSVSVPPRSLRSRTQGLTRTEEKVTMDPAPSAASGRKRLRSSVIEPSVFVQRSASSISGNSQSQPSDLEGQRSTSSLKPKTCATRAGKRAATATASTIIEDEPSSPKRGVVTRASRLKATATATTNEVPITRGRGRAKASPGAGTTTGRRVTRGRGRGKLTPDADNIFATTTATLTISGRRKKPPTVVVLEKSESEEPMQTNPTTTSTTRTGETMVGIESHDDSQVLNDIKDIPVEPTQYEKMAENYRDEGNNCFRRKQYDEAIDNYSKAIACSQFEHQYYGNRSACFLMVGRYSEAMVDARKSVQIEPTFEKGYQRLFRSTLHLGDISACEAVLNLIKGLPSDVKVDVTGEENHLQRLKESLAQVKQDMDKKDYRNALYSIGIAISIATADLTLTTAKADILYCLDKYEEARELVVVILQKDGTQVKAWFVSGKCHYQLDNLDKSTSHLKEALRLAPDSVPIQLFYEKIKQLRNVRWQGKENFEKENFPIAKEMYTEALRFIAGTEMRNDLVQSRCCYNLSVIAQRMKSLDEALVMCSKAIELNPSYVKAYFRRANLHYLKEMFEECVKDYDKLTKIEPGNRDWKNKLYEANLALKKAKGTDYYKILGVGRNASEEEMKKAYKKGALICHPDRHSTASESVQKQNEDQFKELAEAFKILMDPKKRSRYDLGEDLNEPHPGFERFNPSQFFNEYYYMGGQSRHNHGYHEHPTAHGGCPR